MYEYTRSIPAVAVYIDSRVNVCKQSVRHSPVSPNCKNGAHCCITCVSTTVTPSILPTAARKSASGAKPAPSHAPNSSAPREVMTCAIMVRAAGSGQPFHFGVAYLEVQAAAAHDPLSHVQEGGAGVRGRQTVSTCDRASAMTVSTWTSLTPLMPLMAARWLLSTSCTAAREALSLSADHLQRHSRAIVLKETPAVIC